MSASRADLKVGPYEDVPCSHVVSGQTFRSVRRLAMPELPEVETLACAPRFAR